MDEEGEERVEVGGGGGGYAQVREKGKLGWGKGGGGWRKTKKQLWGVEVGGEVGWGGEGAGSVESDGDGSQSDSKQMGEGGGKSELRSCVKVEVDVLGFTPLMVRTVSVDVKQHLKTKGRKRQSESHRDRQTDMERVL